jgi:hypothetical protein
MRIPFWPALVCGWLVAAMIGQTGLAAGPADELSEAATFPGSADDSDRDGSGMDAEDASLPAGSFAPTQYSPEGPIDPYGPGVGPANGGYAGAPVNPGNPWPETSPFNQHRMEQYLNNNGLWQYDSDDNVNIKRIFGVDYLYAHGLRPGDRFIGDPNFKGTPFLPATSTTTTSSSQYPSFSTGSLGTNDNVFHDGFRPYIGYENPDGSGLILSGFVLFENDVNNGNRILNEQLSTPPNPQTLASIPVNNNGVGLALPIDTRFYNQFTQQILGADADYYTMPFFSRPGFQLKMVYGAKYLQISEQFLVNGLDSGLGYTIPTTTSTSGGSSIIGPFFPITPNPYNVIVASSTTSNLVGPMLGLRYDIGGDTFKIWGQSQVGVMADIERMNVASAGLNEVKVPSLLPTPVTLVPSGRIGAPPTNVTLSDTHIAPLFQTSINTEFPFFSWIPYVNKVDFLQNAKVRIGWNFVVVDSVSRAAQIITYNLDGAGIHANRTWFEYNAFNFGVNWKF